MNFKFSNIWKELVLSLSGVILSVFVVIFVGFLVYKKQVEISQAGNFLGIVLPIILTVFSLGGKNERL